MKNNRKNRKKFRIEKCWKCGTSYRAFKKAFFEYDGMVENSYAIPCPNCGETQLPF